MISGNRSERAILQQVNYVQSTHNSVVTASVGKALLHLRNQYLGESPSEDEVNKFTEKCLEALRALPADDDYRGFASAINYMITAVSAPVDEFDRVTIFQRLDNGTMGLQDYIFTLKEALALVWTAINNNAAYQQNYIGNEAQRLAQACEDKEQRIASLLKRFEELHKKPVCHTGQRHELVFMLNKTHAGIDILEDSKTPVLMILKEELSQRLSVAMASRQGQLSPDLAPAMVAWLEESNASKLIALLDPDNEIRARLHALFIAHGASPAAINLDESINDALAYLEFPRDYLAHPVLVAAADILGELEDKNQPERSKALLSLQKRLKLNDLTDWQDVIVGFHRLYMTHKDFQKNKRLIMLSGAMAEEEYDRVFKKLTSYFNQAQLVLTDELKEELDQCQQQLSELKSSMLKDMMENFFVHWFRAVDDDNWNDQKKWYGYLLDTEIVKKIKVSDDAIVRFKRDLSADNELLMTPYMINRIFLHAIVEPSSAWSDAFKQFFQETLAFVENQFNEANEREASKRLYHDSYSRILPQLAYLLKKSNGDNVENIEATCEWLLMPMHARDASEWVGVLALLPASEVISVMNAYRVAILRSINNVDDLVDIFSLIPESTRANFSKLFDVKIGQIIKNGDQLSECLAKFPRDKDKVSFVESLGDKALRIIGTSEELVKCLEVYPQKKLAFLEKFIEKSGPDFSLSGFVGNSENFVKLCQVLLPDEACLLKFLHILGDAVVGYVDTGEKLKSLLNMRNRHLLAYIDERGRPEYSGVKFRIKLLDALFDTLPKLINDGNQLARCLYVYSNQPDKQIELIAKLEDKLPGLINKGEQLARCLKVWPVDSRMELIELLSEKLVNIIGSGKELADCLYWLSLSDRIMLLEKLRGRLNSIINDGEQVMRCFHLLNNDGEMRGQVLLIDALGADLINKLTIDQWFNIYRTENLPDKGRVVLLEALAKKPELIKFHPEFSPASNLRECVFRLKQEDKHVLINALGGRLRDIFPVTDEQSAYFLKWNGAVMSIQYVNIKLKNPLEMDEGYRQYLDKKIFSRINEEIARLGREGATKKGMALLLAAMELQKAVIEAADNSPDQDKGMVIHQTLKKELTRLSESSAAAQYRSPVAAFFKILLGTLLAAPLLFVPLAFEGYRNTFFAAKTERSLKALVHDLEVHSPPTL